MDLSLFSHVDMIFSRYENGVFYYSGIHDDGYHLDARFRPNDPRNSSLSALERFEDLGWLSVRVTDGAGNVLFDGQP